MDTNGPVAVPPALPPVTPPPAAAHDARKLLVLRVVGALVIAVAVYVSVRWGATSSAVNVACVIVALSVGKFVGFPTELVVKLAVARMPPDRAVSLVAEAFRSYPPAAAADATRTLIESLPPVMRPLVPPPPAGASPAGVVLVNPRADETPTS